MKQTLISPKIDFVFKLLFGKEHNKDLLLSLINAVLQHKESYRIKEIQVIHPELDKDHFEEKAGTLDIKARDEQGRLYDIEMQCQNHKAFTERIVYYWAKMYGSQLKKSMG